MMKINDRVRQLVTQREGVIVDETNSGVRVRVRWNDDPDGYHPWLSPRTLTVII